MEDRILQRRQGKPLKSRNIDRVLADSDPTGKLNVRENCGFSLQRGHAKTFAYPVLANLASGESPGDL